MQKLVSAVKFSLSQICVMAAVFVPHTNWLGQNLPYEPFEKLRKQIEKRVGHELKNRGEAHITVITPPEWTVLSEKIKMAEVEKWAAQKGLQKQASEILCIGRGEKPEKNRKLQTYFAVVKSSGLVRFRKHLENSYRKRGGTGAFEASHFHPHVTLGFSERDLHEQDGVIKDLSSCVWKTGDL